MLLTFKKAICIVCKSHRYGHTVDMVILLHCFTNTYFQISLNLKQESFCIKLLVTYYQVELVKTNCIYATRYSDDRCSYQQLTYVNML